VLKFEDIYSEKTMNERFGSEVRPKKKVNYLEYIKKKCDERGIFLIADYDNHEDDLNKTLIYTEIFGGLGGILLRSPRKSIQKHMLMLSLENKNNTNKDYLDKILEHKDKYNSKKQNRESKSVIILPGSNMLENGEVNFLEVLKFISKFPDALVKLHPITNECDVKKMKYIFGDRIVEGEYSAFDIFIKSENVLAHNCSEFSLYSKLFEKNFFDYNNENLCNGTYRCLNEIAENKEELLHLINSDLSGIILEENYEERIEIFLDIFEQVHFKNIYSEYNLKEKIKEIIVYNEEDLFELNLFLLKEKNIKLNIEIKDFKKEYKEELEKFANKIKLELNFNG